MQFFDGKKEAEKLDKKIRNILSENSKDFGKLLIIQIGENASSKKYVELKKRVGERLGIKVEVLSLSASESDKTISDRVEKEVNRIDVSSVIIQLPLPRQKLNKILDLIPIEKDVDLLTTEAQQKYYTGGLERTSPVVRSAEYFIYSTDVVKNLKKAIIVGGGFLVGKPVAKKLENIGVLPEIIEDYVPGKKLDADLIVLSAGIPNLVKGEDISESTNVIDFGSTVVDGITVGDLDMNSQIDHLNFVSPSPGGMGPLVIRFLFLNHLRN